jgi:hypothetical protein
MGRDPVPPPPGELRERYGPIVDRISRERRVRRATAARWLHEAIRFLDLCAATGQQLVPSKRVDHAWHEFLLHTREYEEWCRSRYGRFIHHVPQDRRAADAYERTLDLIEARYGSRDRRIWPRRRTFAGNSCGGSCGPGWGDSSGDGSGCSGGGGCSGG